MQRRSYVVLSGAVTGLVLGGLAFVIVCAAATTRTAFMAGASLGCIGAIAGGLLGQHEHRKRWKKLRLVAAARRELGLAYRSKVAHKELQPFRTLELFQSNGYTPATDWMQGDYRGESVLVFDFEIHGGSQATRTAAQAVVVFPESSGGMPSFQLRPRAWLRDFLGDDVSFDPAAVPEGEQRRAVERFTKSYVVQSPDESAARRVFTATVLHYLADQPNWVAQCDGRHLLLLRPGKTQMRDRPTYVDDAFTVRAILLGGAVEAPLADEVPVSSAPAVVPGKQRGKAYRTAQIVWRVLAGLGSAAFFGAMSGLQFGRRGNPIVAARNGALIGIGFVVVATFLAYLVLTVRSFLKRRPVPLGSEQKEPS
jgi:hypothetical protein